jgi:UPF0176 protein
MFRRLLVHQKAKFSPKSTRSLLPLQTLHTLPKSITPTLNFLMQTSIPSSSFSTTSALQRKYPASKIEGYASSDYKTLAFYKFYKFTKPELEELKAKLLADFGELGIVGRIYISTEGINAQIACPEECLSKLQAYREEYLKPLVGGDLMELNIGTEHGKRSFRALHVRIRKQVIK